jgi:hypothetical protein
MFAILTRKASRYRSSPICKHSHSHLLNCLLSSGGSLKEGMERRHASMIRSNQSTPGLPYRDASKAQPLHILDATIFPHSLIGRLLQIQYPGRSRTA